MSRYNTTTVTPKRTSALKTVSGTALTHEGGVGYKNDSKGELFRLGVNLFAGGEKTYYEGGKERDSRFGGLVEQLAVSDPDWTFEFLRWLRHDGNIRTASVLGAMHAIHARLETGVADNNGSIGYNRLFASIIPDRLDEVGEEFAIWQSLFGKPFPQALKRGAGDALKRLGNEYSFMKYDTSSHGVRVADILSLAHVKPGSPAEAQLFKMALANRYGSEFETGLLPMVAANIELRAKAAENPKVLLDPDALKQAGMTWEDALSLAGSRVPKNELWEALILGGSVGYMAMLRNLRNFQEAGISREATRYVQERLADPEAVAKSRQFPFRFWSAYKNATGTQWAEPLETAIQLSIGNIPELPGNSLVLIDTSGSMSSPMSGKGTIRRDEAAAVFGAALAVKNEGRVDLHMFATTHAPVRVTKGGSVLRIVEEVVRRNGEIGYGTETIRAVSDLFKVKDHDRVFIFTDGQSFPHHGGWGYNISTTIDSVVPKDRFVWAFDLAGYEHMDVPSGEGTRHQLAGLTDAAFRVVPLLERGSSSKWPWEN
jgi:TROVE domain